MSKTYRWGILGTGNIAAKFATCLAVCEGATLHAVGSRSQEGADTFGDRFNIPVRHASYEALANDPIIRALPTATTTAPRMAELDRMEAQMARQGFSCIRADFGARNGTTASTTQATGRNDSALKTITASGPARSTRRPPTGPPMTAPKP